MAEQDRISPSNAAPAGTERRSRRALLAGGLGALGALVAGSLARPTPAEAAGAVALGAVSSATTPTEVRNTSAASNAVALRGRLTHAAGSGASAGVAGIDAGTNGTGVIGVAKSGATARGVFGQSTAGRGVHGAATTGQGVRGTASSGVGVYGQNNDQNEGAGVHGVSPHIGVWGKGGVFGLEGQGGVAGLAAEGQYGVWAEGSDTGALLSGTYGVYATGSENGVYGSSVSGTAGIYGSGPIGVLGQSMVEAGRGVLGSAWANLGRGVLGAAYGTNSIGIFGTQSPSASLAGYFEGDIFVTGLINGAAAQLRLDHPEAPGERWYQQALVGSFERVSVIGGNTLTGPDGKVRVQVPALFARQHRDIRYVLTPVGAAAIPYVASELDEKGRFTIAADRPGLRVSWQLTGVRTDPAAVKAPLRVDVAKSRRHRGRYAQPLLFGQPRSKALEPTPKTPRRPRLPKALRRRAQRGAPG